MATLLLRLSGPMQSWGTTSRFDERDSQLEPSKSGVIGIICAALGRDRSEPLDDLTSLKMGVRVDREGVLMRDYQTATGVVTAESKVKKNHTVISPRYYLADATFLVGLEGNDIAFLQKIYMSLKSPVWPMALGRKSFVPSMPIWIPDGIQSMPLKEALTVCPRIATPDRNGQPLRLILENNNEGFIRLDQPISPFSERRFGPRYITFELVSIP